MGTALLLALGVALVVAFLAIERATDRQLFRVCGCFGEGVAARRLRAQARQGDLPDARLLMAATMADMYVPLFDSDSAFYRRSRRASWGRAVGRLDGGEIGSASITSDRHIRRVVSVAPVVMAVGLAGPPCWFRAKNLDRCRIRLGGCAGSQRKRYRCRLAASVRVGDGICR